VGFSEGWSHVRLGVRRAMPYALTSMLYAQFPFVSANHDLDFVNFLQHIL
jgi:hypothetical protein